MNGISGYLCRRESKEFLEEMKDRLKGEVLELVFGRGFVQGKNLKKVLKNFVRIK
jgi:hypothetical protein